MRLVHLARSSSERAIRRNGLRGTKWQVDVGGHVEKIARGVFAMPVLEDWSATHQWLRELRRWHDERIVAAHFRVADDEQVLVGRFGARHERVRAVVASRRVRAAPDGMEIIVERSIPAREIAALRAMPQLVGWTESPDAANRRNCICRMCLPPGVPDRIRRLRAEWERGLSVLRRSKDLRQRTQAIGVLDSVLDSSRGRGFDAKPLVVQTRDPDPILRARVARLLRWFPARIAEPTLCSLLDDDERVVREAAAEALVRCIGPLRAEKLAGHDEVSAAIREDLAWREMTPPLAALAERLRRG
jgi:hypothetical protein